MVLRELAAEELEDLSIDAALADLGCGKKVLRQLRAELKLEDDAFLSLLSKWRCDRRGVEGALRRLLPASVAESAVLRVEAAAESASALGLFSRPNKGTVEVSSPSKSSRPQPATPTSPVGTPASPSWAGALARLPRLPPGSSIATEGQEERRRALRRRLQLVLAADALAEIKVLGSELRVRGAAGAYGYLRDVWPILMQVEEVAEELLAELICTQVEPVIQRALRGALAALCGGGEASTAQGAVPPVPTRKIRADSQDFLELPEPQIMQVVEFCASPKGLCVFAAVNRSLRAMAEEDKLWTLAISKSNLRLALPPSSIRKWLLQRLASLCVQCRQPTEFEHAIIGCRLCESCERGCPRFALIRVASAIKEYQLSLELLRALPHADGTTGRVYLRSAVEALASKHHSPEGLKQLRSKHVSLSYVGRQRRAPENGRKGGQSSMSANREVKAKYADPDYDPCCFEATALRRANDHEGRLGSRFGRI